MTAKLDYQWHLRELMAARGMFSTTDLRPLLAERDINLSASQVFRLVTEKPERLSMKTLMALIDILGCRMEELIEPVRATGRQRKTASGETAAPSSEPSENGVGSFRPKRARIL
ncbi:helix-turn-helix domain-containing protein [Streptomyces sp. Isolate_219]|uniref:helix-turn-helix domain-containing protein n=1 Tax=Streptomyces sp. Isolate_219 TaxID=2950110 RepID=UPI0021C5FF45|nr:helix-turn-helix transcriptional regulator [Streptomyces sp. Isolate_219]MCR8577565.1 helix-turn-helix transcriptional regulator [Streptomyces sp. Isolate_219]